MSKPFEPRRDRREYVPPRERPLDRRDLAARPLAPSANEKFPLAWVKSISMHPAVYRKRLESFEQHVRAGDWMQVIDADDRTVGFGIYNPKAEIAIRMMSWGPQPPDDAYFDELLNRAVSLRRDVLKLDAHTDCYRVLHGESDGFPGLVVDRLGDVLSAEAFGLGMFQRADEIMLKLEKLLGTRHRLIRCAPFSLSQEGFEADPIASEGLPAKVTIQEFGTRFRVHLEKGHKTGFFCDQRDNRKQLAAYCGGKSVLDLCCYSGGFAVQAKKLGGAEEVIGVDLDEEAIEMAKENANLNQARVRFVHADAFAYMRDMLANNRKFDVVVLDPPKLIRSRVEIEEGTRKHFSFTRLAMQLVAPGGLLLTCTCAGLLPEAEFRNIITSAAKQSGEVLIPAQGEQSERRAARIAQILARTGASPDHPVITHCPETEYLQAFWLRMF